jgi:hypothetical protein
MCFQANRAVSWLARGRTDRRRLNTLVDALPLEPGAQPPPDGHYSGREMASFIIFFPFVVGARNDRCGRGESITTSFKQSCVISETRSPQQQAKRKITVPRLRDRLWAAHV